MKRLEKVANDPKGIGLAKWSVWLKNIKIAKNITKTTLESH